MIIELASVAAMWIGGIVIGVWIGTAPPNPTKEEKCWAFEEQGP